MEQHILEDAYTISKISEMTGVPQNTIRSWEEKLEEAFPVPRDPQGNRFYTARHVQMIKEILRLKDEEKFNFHQIKKVLNMLREREREASQLSPMDVMETESKELTVISHQDRVGDQQQSGMTVLEQTLSEQIRSQNEAFDSRVAQFFNTLNGMLEEHKDFVSSEINKMLASNAQSNEHIIDNLEQKFAKQEEQLNTGIEKMKSDIINEVAVADQEKITAVIKKELADWAVISRQEIEEMKEKKGFFGRIFGKK
jgi:DNA-binding transcriptional MerR regulator